MLGFSNSRAAGSVQGVGTDFCAIRQCFALYFSLFVGLGRQLAVQLEDAAAAVIGFLCLVMQALASAL
jgi:hypothetical protein